MTTTRKHPHDPHEGDVRKETADPEARSRATLEGKISELESSAAEAKDRHLRLAADFDNYKRRARQEQIDTIQHASTEVIARLLPGLDDLHNALDHTPDGVDEAWVKGLELSVRKLEEALSAFGLEPIKAVGAQFDPKYHEAIGHEDSDDYPEDTVVQELRRGYRMRDRVIRPALVKVARPRALPGPDADSPSDSKQTTR